MKSDMHHLFPTKSKVQFEYWHDLYECIFGDNYSDSKSSMLSNDCRVVIYDKDCPEGAKDRNTGF